MRTKIEQLSGNLEKVLSNSELNKRNHQKELADYVKEQNEKYNELLKKKLDLEDKVDKKDSEIAILTKKLDDLNKKILDDLKNQKG